MYNIYIYLQYIKIIRFLINKLDKKDNQIN